jgi:hypothetical protein
VGRRNRKGPSKTRIEGHLDWLGTVFEGLGGFPSGGSQGQSFFQSCHDAEFLFSRGFGPVSSLGILGPVSALLSAFIRPRPSFF